MQIPLKHFVQKTVLPLSALFCSISGFGQTTAINKNPQAILKHGIEQYQNGHYNLATHTLTEFLEYNKNTAQKTEDNLPYADRAQALYYKMLSGVKLRDHRLIVEAKNYVAEEANVHNKQRVAYELAKYYLEDNRDLNASIQYYELAGVSNLTNQEIADSKFELGYAYFITQQFDKARNLFVGIKDIASNKYYLPANYYYGLLSYKEGRLDDALASFKRVRNAEEYKDIIPYYEAEIYYFQKDYDKVLSHSQKYLKQKGTVFYDKEMRLLTGQTLFELKRYQEALPYLEDYYENSDRIRKEELYELAYTYYQLNRYSDAIDKFQPLSNTDDEIGQTSMYLLGDCYLKTGDKKGARNAFGLASEMNYNAGQKEAATFLYNKLSYEQGFDHIAVKGLKDYISNYPKSPRNAEARSLLSGLLLKSNNYAEAYDLLSNETNKDANAWATFQKAAVGRGLQLLQDKDYEGAEQYLTASLENPVNPSLEAVAYFWKGEIAYKQERYNDAVENTRTFLSKAKGYEEAIKKVSSKATVQNGNVNLGYASMKANNYADAATAFSNAQSTSAENKELSKEAVFRQADAAFMQKDFDAALKLYDRAIAGNTGDVDYARYQKALILGLQNKNAEKIELLKTVVQKGNAKIKDEASLELAMEYINLDKHNEAIPLLKKLDQSQTNVSIRSKAAYLLAYAYQDNAQNDLAIAAYKTYIAQYPAGADRNTALKALSTLYSSKPEEYEQFLKKESITDVSSSDVESVFYDAADNDFGNAQYQKAIDGFNKYLEKYPQGTYKVQANYFLGESYFQLKNLAKAKTSFTEVLNNKWNDYSEASASRMGEIYLSEKNYTAAKTTYNQLLENNATENPAGIYEGMMKVSFEESDYEGTRTWADMLLAVGDAAEDSKRNARLYKARSLQIEGKLEDAKGIYQQLDKDNVGNVSAEARYQIASILFAQKRNEAAEKAASYAAQASNNNPYWAVKNYLLLADILADNKDYFNAKATLQSVIKNASDKDLVNEAKQKLEAVKAKEAGKSKLSQ